ncbi:hypothetical protein [Ktedonobacter sp. SOSP1-85]|uniref:hypothetical protein n=1 Tax=Ktedonobacter sp. SOSP1-85 TaxID=2778367 RepID=UPI0019161176|nr:hypothetical protein [Ktedonobacter sp. SOSP1-85]
MSARHELALTLLVPSAIVFATWSFLGPLLQLVGLLLCGIAVPFALILILVPLSAPTTRSRPSSTAFFAPAWSVPTNDSLPYVPRNLNEMYQLLDPWNPRVAQRGVVVFIAIKTQFLLIVTRLKSRF